MVEDLKILQRINKKILQRYHHVYKRNHSGQFHANKELPHTTKKLLQYLIQENIKIWCIIVDKKEWKISHDSNNAYNRIIGLGLQHIFITQYDASISIIQSKIVTSKYLESMYIKDMCDILDPFTYNTYTIEMTSYQKHSWLQFVDAISRAIFQYYEKWDSRFYDIIKGKIEFLTMKNPIALTHW